MLSPQPGQAILFAYCNCFKKGKKKITIFTNVETKVRLQRRVSSDSQNSISFGTLPTSKNKINVLKAPDQWEWKMTLVIWVILLGKEYLLDVKIRFNGYVKPDSPNNQRIHLMLKL